MKPKLSIITDPIPYGLGGVFEHGRRSARSLYHSFFGNPPFGRSKYGGHPSVTRSVVEGLTKIGANFNYNPNNIADLADIVHIPGGIRPLSQMIKFKRQGRISRLTCGPNIVVFSTDADSILASPEIDSVVNHCDFACELWASDHPQLLEKCFRWPAGVDTQYWVPALSANDKKSILIFNKCLVDDDIDRIKPYRDYLIQQGWAVEILTRFGKQGYTPEQYRGMLQRSALMIGFTVGSESQGIAWAEAWSCNVPTLILRNTVNTYHGRTYRCSTAPFLTKATGLFFDDLEDFKQQFKCWENASIHFSPRAWVLDNMSDEVSAHSLYRHVTGGEL